MQRVAVLGSCFGAFLGAACGSDAPPAAAPPAEMPPPTGEDCASAIPVTSGIYDGNSLGAGNERRGSCDVGRDNGADLVYRFELAQESGVTIRAQHHDMVLYLYSGSCEPAQELGCVDEIGTSDTLRIGSLPAGTYYLVVDTYIETGYQTEGGPFSLAVDIGAPYCAGDLFDDRWPSNDTAPGAVYVGTADIDTANEGPLALCPGVSDYFLFGHLGGNVSVGLSAPGGAPAAELIEALPDAAALASGSVDFTEGSVIGSTPWSGALAAGYYYLRTHADGAAVSGLPYSFAIDHTCVSDDGDDPLVELDDRGPARARRVAQPLAQALTGHACGSDQDGFVLVNLEAGDITATLGGGAALGVSVARLDGFWGSESETPLALGSDFTVALAGGDLTVSMPAAAAGAYLLTIDAGSAPAPATYLFNATFGALAAAPPNDTCDAAATLDVSTPGSPMPVRGQTLSATNQIAGACNGDAPTATSSGAADLFYRLSLASASDVELHLDGWRSRFDGALYLFEDPGSCPTDLRTLVPVRVAGLPVCGSGLRFDLRIPALPAANYIVVVDGIYTPAQQGEGGTIPASRTAGGFDLWATAYPAGFPAAASCAAAESLEVPAAGSPTVITFDNSLLSNDLEDYGGCMGSGYEKVFTLQPASDARVQITAEGYDTVLALRSTDCAAGAVVACNDNSWTMSGGGSRLVVDLSAGTDYFLVVDAASEDWVGLATVTLELQ